MASAIAQPFRDAGMGVLFIDMRKECRRKVKHNYCYDFNNRKSVDRYLLATSIELYAAQKGFKIDISCVVTFAEPWYQGWPLLQSMLPGITFNHLLRLHIDVHLRHLTEQYASPRRQMNNRSTFMRNLAERLSQRFGFLGDQSTIYQAMCTRLAGTSSALLPPGTDIDDEPGEDALLPPFQFEPDEPATIIQWTAEGYTHPTPPRSPPAFVTRQLGITTTSGRRVRSVGHSFAETV